MNKTAFLALLVPTFIGLTQNCAFPGPIELQSQSPISSSSGVQFSNPVPPSLQSTFQSRPLTRFPSSSPVPVLRNSIQKLDEGSVNPSFGWRIQNLMIFQAATWSQLPEIDKKTVDGVYHDPAWPICGGKAAYLSKNSQVLRRQMELIHNLNRNLAVAVLMMPRGESQASGFKACWNGQATDMKTCLGGEWRDSIDLYPEVLRAGKARGVPVAPHLSIMGYTSQPSVVDKLRELVEAVSAASKNPATADAALKTDDGRLVVITEGFAFQPGSPYFPADPSVLTNLRKEVADYMRARPDILFLDTLIDDPLHPEIYPSNVVHWAYGQVSDQEFRRTQYQGNFVYHFATLKGAVRTPGDYFRKDTKFSEEERLKLLNMSADAAYPTIISQFNEYGEYLAFEPNTVLGTSEYSYLRWRLSDQPNLPGEPAKLGSHPDNKKPFDPLSIPCDF